MSKRLSLHTSQEAHQAGAYHPSFCSMKRLGVFLPPPGWDASPLEGFTTALSSLVLVYALNWIERERHCESKVPCLKTQHNVSGQGSN